MHGRMKSLHNQRALSEESAYGGAELRKAIAQRLGCQSCLGTMLPFMRRRVLSTLMRALGPKQCKWKERRLGGSATQHL